MISRSCLYRLGLAQDDLDFVPVPYAKVKHRRGSQGKKVDLRTTCRTLG